MNNIVYVIMLCGVVFCYNVKKHIALHIHCIIRRQNEIFRETISVITENNDLFFGIYYFFTNGINKELSQIFVLCMCKVMFK